MTAEQKTKVYQALLKKGYTMPRANYDRAMNAYLNDKAASDEQVMETGKAIYYLPCEVYLENAEIEYRRDEAHRASIEASATIETFCPCGRAFTPNPLENQFCPSCVECIIADQEAEEFMRENPILFNHSPEEAAAERKTREVVYLSATAATVAAQFKDILTCWLTPEERAEVIRRNATPEYLHSQSCATHDFCDANQAMELAFKLEQIPPLEELWNPTWDQFKQDIQKNGF